MKWYERMAVDPAAAYSLVVLGVALDLATLILQLRKNVRGHGNSGFAVIPLALYMAALMSRKPLFFSLGPGFVLGLISRALDASALLLYFGCCNTWIPLLHWKWLGRRRSG